MKKHYYYVLRDCGQATQSWVRSIKLNCDDAHKKSIDLAGCSSFL
jgi:hypothetical protein